MKTIDKLKTGDIVWIKLITDENYEKLDLDLAKFLKLKYSSLLVIAKKVIKPTAVFVKDIKSEKTIAVSLEEIGYKEIDCYKEHIDEFYESYEEVLESMVEELKININELKTVVSNLELNLCSLASELNSYKKKPNTDKNYSTPRTITVLKAGAIVYE